MYCEFVWLKCSHKLIGKETKWKLFWHYNKRPGSLNEADTWWWWWWANKTKHLNNFNKYLLVGHIFNIFRVPLYDRSVEKFFILNLWHNIFLFYAGIISDEVNETFDMEIFSIKV